MGRFFTAGGRRREEGRERSRERRKGEKSEAGKSGRTAETDAGAPIPGLIGRLAVPTIISMLVTSIYNMADTYFVSHIAREE